MVSESSQMFLVANNGDIAGGEVMLFALAEAARDLGVSVTVVGPSDPCEVIDEARRRSLPVVAISARNRRDYILRLRAWDHRRRGLLWCNGLVPSFATAGHPGRVVHLHQRPRGAAQIAASSLARVGALRTVVPSQWMAKQIPGSSLLPNWVPEIAVRRRSDKNDDVVTLGFMGRVSADKGVDVLADAVGLLDRRSPGVYRLLLAGDDRSVPEELAAPARNALGRVDHLVDRPGWMDRAEFFESVDLAVFPSVVGETFGLVVAEAQSAGVPFVISDAGALPEVAGPDHRWVARAGDPFSLAATIVGAVGGTTRADIARSRERWQQEYSPVAGRRRLAEHLSGLGVNVPAPRRAVRQRAVLQHVAPSHA